jgi:hypothetical protein
MKGNQMNDQLQQFARQSLKDGLAKLPEGNHRIFKLMYGRGNHENLTSKIPSMRTVEEAEAMNINDVVDEMPAEKLDWAMQQVENSLKKLASA